MAFNTKQIMQAEAAQVLDFLRARDVRVRIVGGYKTPGFHVYQLERDLMQKFNKFEEALDDLQIHLYAFRARHGLLDTNDPDARVVCRAQDQPLTLEVNRPQIQLLHLDSTSWQAQPFLALAGMSFLTRAGQPLIWKLTDPSQPHALVAGSSGSGKSVLLLSLSLTLALGTGPDKLGMFVVDGGNSSLRHLKTLPHMQMFATDVEGARQVVALVRRFVLMRKAASEENPETRALLIVDELANLMAVMEKQEALAFQRDLAVIAAEGRKFGVHMLVCTQKPLAEVTGSLAKSNMAVRFVGAMSSKSDANTAAGTPGTGAERLAGKGDFLRVLGGNPRRFQVPWIDDPAMLVRRIGFLWHEAPPLTLVVEPEEGRSASRNLRRGLAMFDALPDPPPSNPVADLAEKIRPLYMQRASKNAMARHAFGKPYAGGYASKIDRALAYLQQERPVPPA